MDSELLQIRHKLKRYLTRFIRRPEEVEELVQESFLRVLEQGAKGKIEYPKAYLYRTAHNLALNSLKKKSSRLEDFIEDLDDSDVIELMSGGPTTEQVVLGQARFEQFCRAAARLPPQSRKVFILCKVYGYSQKQVAGELGITISTVEKHVAKTMAMCAGMMAEDRPTNTVIPQSKRRGN